MAESVLEAAAVLELAASVEAVVLPELSAAEVAAADGDTLDTGFTDTGELAVAEDVAAASVELDDTAAVSVLVDDAAVSVEVDEELAASAVLDVDDDDELDAVVDEPLELPDEPEFDDVTTHCLTSITCAEPSEPVVGVSVIVHVSVTTPFGVFCVVTVCTFCDPSCLPTRSTTSRSAKLNPCGSDCTGTARKKEKRRKRAGCIYNR